MADWVFKNHSPYLASLVLSLAEKKIHIFNTYVRKPKTEGDIVTPILLKVRRAIAEVLAERTSENDQEMAEKSIIYLGDFNLHHLEWGGDHVNADVRAEELLQTVNLLSLELLLPPGTVTYKRGSTRTTIDLAFSTPQLTQRLLACQVRKEWGSGVDHYPIHLKFDVQPWKRVQPERFALKRLDKVALKTTLFSKLQQAKLTPLNATLSEEGELTTKDIAEVQVTAEAAEIDKAIQVLTMAL